MSTSPPVFPLMFSPRNQFVAFRRSFNAPVRRRFLPPWRGLLTLAIESSCDDTSVAIVEKESQRASSPAKIHFLENVSSDFRKFGGVHPIAALESHQENLAKLVDKAISHLPVTEERVDAGRLVTLADGSRSRLRPDFISATRGPGMRSNLFVGLDTAKGLAVAWQIPFIGVHHMQAHLLTPRLVSSLNGKSKSWSELTSPKFPFMSLLISGGHTLLVNSTSLTHHRVMANTSDIAIGDALDKSARVILPDSVVRKSSTPSFGQLLEQFAFPNGPTDYAKYNPPKKRGDELVPYESKWGWSLTMPLANTRDPRFCFSGIPSAIGKIVKAKEEKGEDISDEERVDLARAMMQVSFEHLASRIVMALEPLTERGKKDANTLVISGGVASNRFLMTVLRSILRARGYGHVKFVVPPPYLCTDNAAMIGWAGIEMFEMGWRSDLSSQAIKSWSLDPTAEDRGIMGAPGWKKDISQIQP